MDHEQLQIALAAARNVHSDYNSNLNLLPLQKNFSDTGIIDPGCEVACLFVNIKDYPPDAQVIGQTKSMSPLSLATRDRIALFAAMAYAIKRQHDPTGDFPTPLFFIEVLRSLPRANDRSEVGGVLGANALVRSTSVGSNDMDDDEKLSADSRQIEGHRYWLFARPPIRKDATGDNGGDDDAEASSDNVAASPNDVAMDMDMDVDEVKAIPPPNQQKKKKKKGLFCGCLFVVCDLVSHSFLQMTTTTPRSGNHLLWAKRSNGSCTTCANHLVLHAPEAVHLHLRLMVVAVAVAVVVIHCARFNKAAVVAPTASCHTT